MLVLLADPVERVAGKVLEWFDPGVEIDELALESNDWDVFVEGILLLAAVELAIIELRGWELLPDVWV